MAIDIQALVAAQKQKLDTVEPVTQEVLLGDDVVGVRFWPVSGGTWEEITSKNPPRAGNQSDTALGYNLAGVVRDYPRTYLVVGDDVQPVVGTQWAEVYDVLSGPDKKNLGYAVWGLNEYDPAQRMAAAGKASAGSRKKKRN